MKLSTLCLISSVLYFQACQKENTSTNENNESATDTSTKTSTNTSKTTHPDGTVTTTTTNTDGTVTTTTAPVTNTVVGKLALSFAVASVNSASNASLHLLDDPTTFKNSAIASGAPDEMTLTITRITLEGTDSDNIIKRVNVFEDTAGKAVKITGSSINLSTLFTTFKCYKADGTELVLTEGQTCKCGVDTSDHLIVPNENGECPAQVDADGEPLDIRPPVGVTDIEVGTYSKIKITIKDIAKIKGCVTGDFQSNYPINGLHTYCTKTNLSQLATTLPVASDYESGEAEEMDFDLQGFGNPEGSHDYEFDIDNNLTVTEDSTTDITMLFDLNRVLRFYNANTADEEKAPNPGMPFNRAYFFTGIVFNNSVFAFVGKVGSIKGWKYTSQTCSGTKTTTYTPCSGSTTYVNGWVTVIYDTNGVPFISNVNPDDDNSFTTLKGMSWANTDEEYESFVKKSTNIYDANIFLGDLTTKGTIFDFDVSVDLNNSSTYDYIGVGSLSYGRVTLLRML